MNGPVIWLLVVFSFGSDGKLELVEDHKEERVCRQAAIHESMKHPLKAYTCIPSTGIQLHRR